MEKKFEVNENQKKLKKNFVKKMTHQVSSPQPQDDCATKTVSNKESSSLKSRLKEFKSHFDKQYFPKFLFLLKKYRLDTENGKRILIGLSAVIFVAIIWFIFDRKTPLEDPDEILRPLAHAPEVCLRPH